MSQTFDNVGCDLSDIWPLFPLCQITKYRLACNLTVLFFSGGRIINYFFSPSIYNFYSPPSLCVSLLSDDILPPPRLSVPLFCLTVGLARAMKRGRGEKSRNFQQ